MTSLSNSDNIVDDGTEYEKPPAGFFDIVTRIGCSDMSSAAVIVKGACSLANMEVSEGMASGLNRDSRGATRLTLEPGVSGVAA